jgi:hypothetical protein
VACSADAQAFFGKSRRSEADDANGHSFDYFIRMVLRKTLNIPGTLAEEMIVSKSIYGDVKKS